jgi:hypothetical protein
VVEHRPYEAVCLTHAVDDPVESARCVRSREDVLVHAERAEVTISVRTLTGIDNFDLQKTPVEVLELPTSSDTRHLEDKDTIIGKKVIDLLEEGAVSAETDVL